MASKYIYQVKEYQTGLFSGTMKASELQSMIAGQGAQGWRLARTIRERKRMLLFFSRETHFLIFEKEMGGAGEARNPDLPEGW